MICKINGCEGEVNICKPIGYEETTGPFFYVYPCIKCGRLFRGNGCLVFSRSGKKAFRRDSKTVYED